MPLSIEDKNSIDEIYKRRGTRYEKNCIAVSHYYDFGMLAAGCGTSGTKELVVNVGPEPATIDPALNSAVDGATLLIHAFEGLMSLDENGVPVEAQAEL